MGRYRDTEHEVVKSLSISGGELHHFVNGGGISCSAIYVNGEEIWWCERSQEIKMLKDWEVVQKEKHRAYAGIKPSEMSFYEWVLQKYTNKDGTYRDCPGGDLAQDFARDSWFAEEEHEEADVEDINIHMLKKNACWEAIRTLYESYTTYDIERNAAFGRNVLGEPLEKDHKYVKWWVVGNRDGWY